jgi:23S rRNA (pseudouridine1915-N3)-methyltransferase
MKIHIIASGKLKKSPLLDLCAEYLKRMHWDVKIREVDGPITAKHLPDPGLIVALDERGETLSSPDLAKKMEKWRDSAPGNTITFIIGEADGLDESIRKKAKFLLSFGKQTWPHMLVRVMLLEQIYRAQQIIAGHPYHRQ